MSLAAPGFVFRSCRRRYMPSFARRASFPRAGCGKSACPVRRAGRGNSTKPNRTEVTLRESAVNYHRETKVTAPLLDSTRRESRADQRGCALLCARAALRLLLDAERGPALAYQSVQQGSRAWTAI